MFRVIGVWGFRVSGLGFRVYYIQVPSRAIEPYGKV